MKKRIINVVTTLVLGLLLLFGYYYLNKRFGLSISCMFYKITGLYCPGCGITRCFFAILEGDFYKAFMYNQLVFILIPFAIIYFIYKAYLYITSKNDKMKIPNIFWIILLIIVIVFGILRNVYFSEFLLN